MSVIALYHHLSAVEKTSFKVMFTKWKRRCDLHSAYYTKVAARVSCIGTLIVAVRGAHEKEEAMENEQALGLFLQLFICHISMP